MDTPRQMARRTAGAGERAATFARAVVVLTEPDASYVTGQAINAVALIMR